MGNRYFDSGSVYAVAIVLPVLATIAVATRLYVRRGKGPTLGWDDFTICLALGLAWGLGIILIDGAAYDGFGAHTATNPVTGMDEPAENSLYATKLYYAFVIILILTIGIIKTSLILLYRRIFISALFQRLSLGLLALIGAWTTAFFFARTFACRTHFTAFWTTGATIAEYCSPYQPIEFGFAISDVVTDLIVLATPIPFIWQLHMSTSQKLLVTGIFLLGLLSTASAVVRLAFLTIDGYETKPGFRDVLGIDTIMLVWSQVEAGIAIVAACLPTLRPLFKGNSPESLINSLRSIFSLQSLGSGGSRRGSLNRQRRGSDSEQLATTADAPPTLAKKASSSNAASVATQHTAHGDHLDLPDDNIALREGWSKQNGEVAGHSSVVGDQIRRGKPVIREVLIPSISRA